MPVLVVASGKGGVGKSVIATAMAAAAARDGVRTLLVDGDQNLGNLHVLLGVRPAHTLDDVLDGVHDPRELIVPVAPRLGLLPAASGSDLVQGLGPTDRARLHRRLTQAYDGYELVIVDAGAGLEATMRCTMMRTTDLLLVTLPEAAAMTDAYAVAKVVSGQLPDLPIDVLINRVLSPDEGEAAWERLATAAAKFLGRGLGYAGTIPDDPQLRTRLLQPQTSLLTPELAGPALGAAARLVRSHFSWSTHRSIAGD